MAPCFRSRGDEPIIKPGKTYYLLMGLQLGLAIAACWLVRWDIPIPGDGKVPVLTRILPYACGMTAWAHGYMLLSRFGAKRMYCRWMVVLIWILLLILWTSVTVKLAERAGRFAIQQAANADADLDPVYAPGAPGGDTLTLQVPGKHTGTSADATSTTSTSVDTTSTGPMSTTSASLNTRLSGVNFIHLHATTSFLPTLSASTTSILPATTTCLSSAEPRPPCPALASICASIVPQPALSLGISTPPSNLSKLSSAMQIQKRGNEAADEEAAGFDSMLVNSHWEAVTFFPRLKVATGLSATLALLVLTSGLVFGAAMKKAGGRGRGRYAGGMQGRDVEKGRGGVKRGGTLVAMGKGKQRRDEEEGRGECNQRERNLNGW